jgi:hypothetical protein
VIDLKCETPIDLVREGPEYLGKSRNGRPVHGSYLVRAVTRGVNGHRLEALRCGRRWVTTVEALQRWLAAQTAGAGASAPDSRVVPDRSPARRARDAERADRRLKELGL